MHPYVSLAKEAVEKYFTDKSTLKPNKNLPAELFNKKGGVFVTIYNQEELRGCIGTFLPTKKNLAEEIISNAITAATQDYRFLQITKRELPELSFEVSVLSEPEKINSLEKLDPRSYGVIVAAGRRRGLLLPDLEGIDTAKEQVSIAARKGDINLDTDEIELYRFTTTKYIT